MIRAARKCPRDDRRKSLIVTGAFSREPGVARRSTERRAEGGKGERFGRRLRGKEVVRPAEQIYSCGLMAG